MAGTTRVQDSRTATLTCFITIGGRGRPVEITFKTGKDALGWDQVPGQDLARDRSGPGVAGTITPPA